MNQLKTDTEAKPEVPKPKKGRLHDAVPFIASALASTAIVGVTFWPDIGAAAETPNAQERLLSDTLAASPVGVNARVKCQKGLLAKEHAYGRVHSIGLGDMATIPFDQIFLDQAVCDVAESYIESDNKNAPTYGETLGIVALEHEGLHIKFDTRNEPATACRAFQYTIPFMQGLGMTDGEHIDATKNNYQVYVDLGPKYWSTECTDGGKYDLDPANSNGLPVWK